MLNVNALKHLFISLSPVIFTLFPLITTSKTTHKPSSSYTKEANIETQQQDTDSKKHYTNFQKKYLSYKKDKDTLSMGVCLMNMSDIQKRDGKYSLSFDHLWEALFLAQESENVTIETQVHRRIADLYDIYNMDNSSLFHRQQSLIAAKKALAKDKQNDEYIISSYMNLAVRQRKQGNYQMALNYLDSCVFYKNKTGSKSAPLPFLDAEKGYIMIKLGDTDAAHKFLHRSIKAVKNSTPIYKGNIYIHMGDLKMALSETDSAVYYYKQGAKLLIPHNKFYKSYERSSNVLLKLAEIYNTQHKTSLAYKLLYQSKMIRDSLIQIQHSTNSELFEIKNSYLKNMKKKDEFIEQQQEELKQNKQIQLRLKIILALAILLGGASFWIIRMRLRLKKTVLEKNNTELKSKLTEERIKSEVELKSKELTSYALQMIDKDTAIDELLEVLKNESPSAYKPLKIRYKSGSKDLWDDFNRRFTEVNSAFYDRLNTRHPDLSPTERKHCALIKLNFTPKEAAQILNITHHSVHISRSRIRKKIGLERSENLGEYIAGL